MSYCPTPSGSTGRFFYTYLTDDKGYVNVVSEEAGNELEKRNSDKTLDKNKGIDYHTNKKGQKVGD